MRIETAIIGGLVGLASLCCAPLAAAEEFRVDTEIFVWKDDKPREHPVAETLTIFANGIVYDFQLSEPREIVIFDPERGRFTVLNESRRIKSSISTQELLDFALSLDAHAAQSKDPLFTFAAKPDFTISSENVQENGQPQTRVTLASEPIYYDAIGHKPQLPEAVAAYRQFADWFARLNAARPGNLPPGPRLVLNQELADRGLLPLEITRTITLKSLTGAKQVVVSSRHLANWSLSGEDRKRMERAGNGLASFQNVSFDEYTRPADQPATKQARR
jgi:hypothetical protein